jgi:hypothetical protein
MLKSDARRNEVVLVMRVLRNSFRLQNTNFRWYRDKYLTVIFVVCFLVGFSLVWGWPPPHDNLIRGMKFLGVAALCLLVSSQRFLILAGALAYIASRGLVGLALYHSVGALIVGLAASAIFYLLAVQKKINLSPNYEINDYSYSELAIDMAALGLLLLLYSRLN